jgi:acyl-CoA synthetase (AMP-forming)/AMP-acid ligase II
MGSRLAAGLLALGLPPGDRVASLMPNRPGLIVHYLACLKAGLVATPLDYRYTAPEIDHALAVSDASALLVHAERLAESRLAGSLRLGWITYGAAGGPGPAIVHDGSNISPREVEAALLEHPAVEGAGVIGIHDAVHGERVRAYVTFRDGAERPTSQELIRFARERIGYKALEEIVLLDRMPRTASGKTDRTALKRVAEAALTR